MAVARGLDDEYLTLRSRDTSVTSAEVLERQFGHKC